MDLAASDGITYPFRDIPLAQNAGEGAAWILANIHAQPQVLTLRSPHQPCKRVLMDGRQGVQPRMFHRIHRHG